MKTYDWIVFDYGGTLDAKVDNPDGDRPDMSNLYGEIMLDWFAEMGYNVDKSAEQLQKFTEQAHSQIPGSAGQLSVGDNINYYSKWIRWIYRAVGIEGYIMHTELESARLFMMQQAMKRLARRPSKDTIEALKAFKQAGIRMGVLSNNSGYVEDLVAYIGLTEYFEFVIDSARIGLVKPDRRIFDYAVKEYQLEGRQLYVGDSYKCDVIGAIAAGWDVAWLSEQEPGQDLSPDNFFQISCISDLCQAVLPEKNLNE